MSVLREIQSEYNALVPLAHSLGIFSGVRHLTTTHESIAVGRRRLAELHRRIALRQPQTMTSVAALTGTQSDTFGVEIECLLPAGMSHHALAAAITAAGVACHAEGYNHITGSDWKVVTDGSLGSYVTGAEVVSPILSGEAGFLAMKIVMDAVRLAGCKINRKCGFHVHVGARNENVQFFKSLARIYRKFDSAVNSVLAPSRANNPYAHAHVINQAALDAATTIDAVTLAVGQRPGAQHVRGVSRYRKLNFCSYYQHGTIEVRNHQGTVEANKAAQWVRFCLALVAVARTNPSLVLVEDNLEALISLLGLDATQAAYWRSRQTFFATRTQRRA